MDLSLLRDGHFLLFCSYPSLTAFKHRFPTSLGERIIAAAVVGVLAVCGDVDGGPLEVITNRRRNHHVEN